MKKIMFCVSFLSALMLGLVACSSNDEPSGNSGSDVAVCVSGLCTNVDAPQTTNVFYLKGNTLNTIETDASLTKVNVDRGDVYVMAVKSPSTYLYKNGTLVATTSLNGVDFCVNGGNIQVVGSATLQSGFPTNASEKNAASFNSGAAGITLFDAQTIETSEAAFVTWYGGTYYTAGFGFLTSPSKSLMSWTGDEYALIYGPQYTTNFALVNGKYACFGTKVVSSGKSAIVQTIDSVETVLTSQSSLDSATVMLANIQDVKAYGGDVYVAGVQTSNNKSIVYVWKNGQLYYSLPSTTFARLAYSGGSLYMVTKGSGVGEPYVLRKDGVVVYTFPSNVTAIHDIEPL